MRRITRPALVLSLVALLALPIIAADKPKDLYAKGQDAEARQEYEAAYEFFKQAYDLRPKDLRYRSAFERVRFEAAASLVHEGQKLREDGKLDDAVAAFQKALTIDPSLFLAKQELNRTLKMINDLRNPPPQAAGPPPELERKVEELAGPVELASISNVPITIKMTDKSDTVYRTIGQLAGINVLFDPDYTPRPIKVELNGVSLEDALEITAIESKTFWRPVTSNTIFVAADNVQKRKEVEQSVLKTFYLTNISQPTELQEVVNAIRAVLDVQRVQQLLSQNAVIVRGTPDQVALAQKIVEDLDKARPEVIVDIAIMQVSKDRSRTLGFNPPTSATVTLQSNLNTTTPTTTNPITGIPTTSPSSSTTNGINLNTLGNLNATDFQVTIPSANLSAVMNASDTKLIQNPQLRALDGQKASLKIGDRVPIATGSFQPGIGGVGINPLVNTQFQYLDVGVNIDITPHIHSEHEVTLKMTLEVSSVSGTENIGGISQPVIGQRRIEHETRLQDGEVNLVGGILEDTETHSLSGYPWLAKLPILKYLFGQEDKERQENEIVFAITPHIVRAQDVTDENLRVVDLGRGSSVKVSHVDPRKAHPSNASAPQAASSAGAARSQENGAKPAASQQQMADAPKSPAASIPGGTVPVAAPPGATSGLPKSSVPSSPPRPSDGRAASVAARSPRTPAAANPCPRGLHYAGQENGAATCAVN